MVFGAPTFLFGKTVPKTLYTWSPDAIGVEHLPSSLTQRPKAAGFDGGENLSMDSVESDHIRKVLKLCEGSRSQAARLLGIHRSTLLQKIAKYGLDG